MSVSWEFVEHSPFALEANPLSSERQTAWQALQKQLPIGSILTGKIFARTHFGVFFDSGIGFPVRMNVPDFGKPEGGMIFPDDYPPLDSEFSGQLVHFDESWHQLVTVRIQA